MKLLTATFVILAVTAIVIHGAPAENKSLGGTESKFLGQPFDEVVVESTLNVKRKSDTRQSRKQGSEIKRAKRQHGSRNSFPFPNFEEGSSAQAAAQAQSHRAESPFGAFGASGKIYAVLSLHSFSARCRFLSSPHLRVLSASLRHSFFYTLVSCRPRVTLPHYIFIVCALPPQFISTIDWFVSF
ncbi:uncharacterized protein LOC132706200 isoform X1 [Cylas formicarius]|uniref:uncharacterized protein LOC132706200 isoform X1 n=1 Tax=Cylas formicarius TaxID=197179 RepID=UPI002958B4AB|nr:uncharacterized protein LOC132706200 isoform X1 [Cylas formicarius]